MLPGKRGFNELSGVDLSEESSNKKSKISSESWDVLSGLSFEESKEYSTEDDNYYLVKASSSTLSSADIFEMTREVGLDYLFELDEGEVSDASPCSNILDPTLIISETNKNIFEERMKNEFGFPISESTSILPSTLAEETLALNEGSISSSSTAFLMNQMPPQGILESVSNLNQFIKFAQEKHEDFTRQAVAIEEQTRRAKAEEARLAEERERLNAERAKLEQDKNEVAFERGMLNKFAAVDQLQYHLLEVVKLVVQMNPAFSAQLIAQVSSTASQTELSSPVDSANNSPYFDAETNGKENTEETFTATPMVSSLGANNFIFNPSPGNSARNSPISSEEAALNAFLDLPESDDQHLTPISAARR